MTTAQPTDNEQLAHARERAVETYRYDDRFEAECDIDSEGCGLKVDTYIPADVVKEAVRHGWDAAMEYTQSQSCTWKFMVGDNCYVTGCGRRVYSYEDNCKFCCFCGGEISD